MVMPLCFCWGIHTQAKLKAKIQQAEPEGFNPIIKELQGMAEQRPGSVDYLLKAAEAEAHDERISPIVGR